MRKRPAICGAAIAAAMAVPALAAPASATPPTPATDRAQAAVIACVTQPQAVTCTFRAVPPLAWHLLLRRPHAVRLRMTLNHQALTVTAAAPGIVSRPVRIPPNDHRTRTLLPAVRAGVSVTVRITGARQAIAGQLTY